LYGVRDTVLRAYGDLQERLRPQGPLVACALHVRQVLCADGSLFHDDAKSEVMILGDSFVDQCRTWDSSLGAQLARYIGRPTHTYFSLLSNTEGPCMYSRKPAAFPKGGIVIWAFSSRVLRSRMCAPSNGSAQE
jgi:hypothetical protein